MSKELELLEQTNGAVIEKNEIISTATVEGTPFKLVDTEHGCFVGFGRYRVTDLMSREECKQMIEEKSWELLLSVMGAVAAEEVKIFNHKNELV